MTDKTNASLSSTTSLWLPLLLLLFLFWQGAASCTPTQPGTEPTANETTTTEQQQNEPTNTEPQQSEPTTSEPTPTDTHTKEKPTTKEPIADISKEPPTSPEPSLPDAATKETPPESGKSPVTLAITSKEDIVSSYLLSGSDWNYLGGTTAPLGRHSNTARTSYHTAFRFKNIMIPKGSTIQSAWLSFMPHNEVDSSKRLMINIYAEKVGDSAAYDPTQYKSGRPDQRLRTKAKIDRWIVRCRADCSSDIKSPKYEYDCPQRKKDCWDRTKRYQVPKPLKDIVQEVIDQPDWKAGNAISLFLFNAASDREGKDYQDSRTIIGYDAQKPGSAPQLIIEFK
jgi:hypothetical protein